ncbi:MAG: rod shape-determining protein MreC [Parcubacteria group bacterium]|nr:rod shape-determining protein MreC [Parcubacteria group bacterium]MCR4342354.1 rod shape-determining protein MreC [Patescibacteria group bacterium]
MKMISRHNKKTGKKFLILTLLLAMILIAIMFAIGNRIISSATLSIASPIFAARGSINNWYEYKSRVIKDKELLVDENLRMKEQLMEKDMRLMTLGLLEKENNELKNLLGRMTEERRSIIASVTLRPPQVPYDVLIIDIGRDDGIEEGMLVGAYGDILLGYVEKVFKDASRIRLYSSAGESINVLVDNTNIFTVASGVGGGNFEISLPRVDNVKEGDLIITPGANPFILGMAEFIKADMADAFQRVFFRTPLNIQELKWVEVFPDLSALSSAKEMQIQE